ncbi:MAG: ATP-binding protein [Steroidobacteraceae bacterium]|jgi:signal transduction histidine kinase|nr:ATP-binding protein [Steroidobacteraceae bacterium]
MQGFETAAASTKDIISPSSASLLAASDVLLALAYLAILFVLVYMTWRRRDLRFNLLVLCFGVFLATSSITHVVGAFGGYLVPAWLNSALRMVTAAASVPTVVLLWRSLPNILSLPSRRELRDANESLARANRELEAFTASVSHDLRSPLTTIAGQAGMLELSMPNASEDQVRRMHRIQRSVRQMSELIEALLALSRISRHTLRREHVNISDLVEDIVLEHRQKDPGRAVEVTVQPHMHAHGDRRLLADLFQNLIANAWKFTSKTPDARIEIGQSQCSEMATLYVRDNGAGFDMQYESKLFKPFQRLHGPTEFEGSGIGLATVARIVDRHGGRIWADGAPNAGATFYFTLPTAPITDEFLARRSEKRLLVSG